MQVPALPGSAHDRQVPVQVVPQQIPCSQNPELHSAALPQVAPGGFLPQLPLMQLLGATQSPSFAQMTMHLLSLPHMNGAHIWVSGATQAPSPSQRAADFSTVPVHDCGLQMTPEGYLWQAPVPSQTPSLPQLCTPMSSHWLRGSVPRSAGMQVPTALCRAHVKQASVQAPLQQTPSTQNPLSHSVPTRQDVPSGWPGVPPPSPPEESPAPPSAGQSYAPSPTADRRVVRRVLVRLLASASAARGDQRHERTGNQRSNAPASPSPIVRPARVRRPVS